MSELQPDAAAGAWICATCGVEHSSDDGVCAICADERQWVPAAGQQWTTAEELRASGRRARLEPLEPDLFGLLVEPPVGIGHHGHLVRTPAGNLLWELPGYLDDEILEQVRAQGQVVAIASGHPHMFGAQTLWSEALGSVPVLVAAADERWLARRDASIEMWSGIREVVPGVTLHQVGGHFPGSAVVLWGAGAEGRGVLLTSDSIAGNPDRATVTFMRSFPNRIPLSAAVVERVAGAVEDLGFDRLYDNFGHTVDHDASGAVSRSAKRYAAWVRGDFDELT